MCVASDSLNRKKNFFNWGVFDIYSWFKVKFYEIGDISSGNIWLNQVSRVSPKVICTIPNHRILKKGDLYSFINWYTLHFYLLFYFFYFEEGRKRWENVYPAQK